MFIFILGLGPVYDEYRDWASNLVFFFLFIYFIESLSRFCISYLFCVYFVFNCYLSLNAMLCSFHIMSCFSYLFTSNVAIMCCH